MHDIGNQLSVSNSIAAQFVRYNLSQLTAISREQSFKETLRSTAITALLKKDIYHLTILIDSTPQVLLFALYLDENLIYIECITKTTMFLLQLLSIS